MLTKAYEDGYRDGVNSVVAINAPTIPYNGDAWDTITNYSTTTTNTVMVDTAKTPLTANSICIGSDLEANTITLASQTKVANSSN